MLFKSTRARSGSVSFRSAVLQCLPEDGGLYVPVEVSDVRQLFLYMDSKISYPDLVSTVTPALLGSELNPIAADYVANEAYSFEPKLVQLDEHLSLLELHNGPTGVFKDFGIAYCAAVIEQMVDPQGRAVTLTATTGRAGASIARAFAGRENTLAVLLYPQGPIHGLNPETFVENGGNILPIEIKGSFDDCQALIQAAFKERALIERYSLTSANTINIGRLLPQSFYYLYSFIMLKKHLHGDLLFSVPSGNFGNLIAGLYAWKFGMPVNGFIAAMNANNSFGPFFKGQAFVPSEAIKTISSSMDVGKPTNYERMAAFYAESPSVMRNMVIPRSVSDEETRSAIIEAYDKWGILIDPHTAVAYAAAQQVLKSDLEDGHIVVLSTGHPSRKAALLKEILGVEVEVPEYLKEYQQSSKPVASIPVELEALESLIAGASPS